MNEYDIFKIFNSNTELKNYLDEVRGTTATPNDIYTGTPKENFILDKNAPWIRITSIPGDDADYADDQRYIEYPKFQIDFWIQKVKTKQLIKLEKIIYELMRLNGYERYYKDHPDDPDMPNLKMVQGNYQFQGFTDK